MALTNAQKAKIRLYLGYSDMSRQGFQDLEGVMNNLSTDAETIVIAALASLATIDTSLDDVASANRAGIIEVDNGGVKWENGSAPSRAIAAAGRRHVNRIASTLGIRIRADMFGAGAVQNGVVARG